MAPEKSCCREMDVAPPPTTWNLHRNKPELCPTRNQSSKEQGAYQDQSEPQSKQKSTGYSQLDSSEKSKNRNGWPTPYLWRRRTQTYFECAWILPPSTNAARKITSHYLESTKLSTPPRDALDCLFSTHTRVTIKSG